MRDVSALLLSDISISYIYSGAYGIQGMGLANPFIVNKIL